jgi:hypothetical protein
LDLGDYFVFVGRRGGASEVVGDAELVLRCLWDAHRGLECGARTIFESAYGGLLEWRGRQKVEAPVVGA